MRWDSYEFLRMLSPVEKRTQKQVIIIWRIETVTEYADFNSPKD